MSKENKETKVNKEKKSKKTQPDVESKAAEEVNEEQTDPAEKQQENEIDSVCPDCEKLKAELDKVKDAHIRCAAEYANFRTRTEKEKSEIYTNATMDAVKNILPIADSIDMALASSADAGDEYVKGLKLIKAQLDKAFEDLGVKSFGEPGDAFDPQLHNAISKTEDDSLGENVISAVFQKGYMCRDKVLRYCMVQVANS